ncbi:MAG: acetyl-CoA C-acetyltransferase [Deltaproteobacteria bacterium]|nr:acetyl-CoA C-acetyltransferase [Deltaproteobacteria bacterium]
MRRVVIVSGARTPVGRFGGTLKDIPCAELGALAIKGAFKKVSARPVANPTAQRFGQSTLIEEGRIELEKAGYDYPGSLCPVPVDEVIMGNAVGAGQGQNLARQASLRSGIPKEAPAYTVNKVCGSGLKAVTLAAQAIASGEADVIVAGGVENMSRIPYALPAARWGARMHDATMVDLLIHDGLWEGFYGYHIGITAENLQALYGISRREQDELAAQSHRRARRAIADGLFADEIVPVRIVPKKGAPFFFDTDERPVDTTVEKLAQLPPAFREDGTVTAGNASGVNDAAAALLLMSEKKAKELGLRPLARVVSYASGGVDPAYMGLGAVPAVRSALSRAGLTVGDLDLVELNEVFAVQAIGCTRELGLDPEKTNVLGSGISIGHPIGCTGARILVTLIHELRRRGGELGLAGLCIGGGMGMAMVVAAA